MSAPRGRPRQPEVDERIVDATRALVAEGGLEAVTIASVAARAGVGRPTVYRRYASTDDLARAVLYADLENVIVEVVDALDHDASVEDQLTAIGLQIFRYYARNPRASRGMLQASLFADPPWVGRFGEQIQRFLGWIAGVLERQKAAGRLSPEVDSGVLAMAFFSFYLVIAISGTHGTMGPPEQQALVLRTLLRQHLGGKTP